MFREFMSKPQAVHVANQIAATVVVVKAPRSTSIHRCISVQGLCPFNCRDSLVPRERTEPVMTFLSRRESYLGQSIFRERAQTNTVKKTRGPEIHWNLGQRTTKEYTIDLGNYGYIYRFSLVAAFSWSPSIGSLQ